jgi:hypothetical protein
MSSEERGAFLGIASRQFSCGPTGAAHEKQRGLRKRSLPSAAPPFPVSAPAPCVPRGDARRARAHRVSRQLRGALDTAEQVPPRDNVFAVEVRPRKARVRGSPAPPRAAAVPTRARAKEKYLPRVARSVMLTPTHPPFNVPFLPRQLRKVPVRGALARRGAEGAGAKKVSS